MKVDTREKSTCCLAVDLGASSGRVMAGVFDGTQLELREVHRFPNEPVRRDGTLFWNFEELLREVKEGLRRGIAEAASDGSPVQSIGVDSWGVDFGLLDLRGNLITPPVHYRDERTNGIMERVFAEESNKEEIFAETGIQFVPINSLYQLAALRRTHPGQLKTAKHFLMIADLVHYFLTGTIGCEFTNATTTQLYNPRESKWSDKLIAKLALPREIFPPVIATGSPIDKLTPAVADELGIAAGDAGPQVIAVATHDTGSAVAAVPVAPSDIDSTKSRFAYLSCGTWSLLGTEISHPIINDRACDLNFTNEGGVFGTFRLLKNIMGLWLLQESRGQWRRDGKNYAWDEIITLARSADSFHTLIDPDDPSFFPPGDMPARIRHYCQETEQAIPETDGAIVRCILESLALKYRDVLDSLEQLTGFRLAPLHIVGGGAMNELLCQWTANACDRQVVAGPTEATALGNLGMQLIAAGKISGLQEMRALIRNSFSPRIHKPQNTTEWEGALRSYKKICSKREQNRS